MKLSLLMCLVFGMSGTAFAQAPAPADSDMEGRYVQACLKESTQAYCHCEFQAVKSEVKDDSKDVAFLVQLEEQTAGKRDRETNRIIGRLASDKRKWVIAVQQMIQPVIKKCPEQEYRKRK